MAVPYGGDRAVARSMVAVHVRNPWTGRCRGCREAYPCRDRQDAAAVLGVPSETRRYSAIVVLLLVAMVTVVVAVVAVGLAR